MNKETLSIEFPIFEFTNIKRKIIFNKATKAFWLFKFSQFSIEEIIHYGIDKAKIENFLLR